MKNYGAIGLVLSVRQIEGILSLRMNLARHSQISPAKKMSPQWAHDFLFFIIIYIDKFSFFFTYEKNHWGYTRYMNI